VQAGLSRAFTDNGDGTITDQRTGLRGRSFPWMAAFTTAAHTWNDAISVKIAALNIRRASRGTVTGGCRIIELQSLVDYGANPPLASAFYDNCSFGCDVLTCSCGVGRWTSTQYRPLGGYAFVVDDGRVASRSRPSPGRSRPSAAGSDRCAAPACRHS
jgi:hypothetical protein